MIVALVLYILGGVMFFDLMAEPDDEFPIPIWGVWVATVFWPVFITVYLFWSLFTKRT